MAVAIPEQDSAAHNHIGFAIIIEINNRYLAT